MAAWFLPLKPSYLSVNFFLHWLRPSVKWLMEVEIMAIFYSFVICHRLAALGSSVWMCVSLELLQDKRRETGFYFSLSSTNYWFPLKLSVEPDKWQNTVTHLEPVHQPFRRYFFFRVRVSQTICLGWLRTSTLLISASFVARITGMSHQHPATLIVS
jgi:hypothetical protein